MFTRRAFMMAAAAAAGAAAAVTRLTSKERIDHALAGQEVDRSPFSYWHHFLDEKLPPERHAASTLDFHRKFHTDFVKVMSDYPYPKPKAEWFVAREEKNPFPAQIKSLELIRDGLAGSAYFMETIFNPWKVAENLSSPEEVLKLKATQPQRLLDALEVIAKSEANHARLAIRAGASGIFLAIANAQDGILSRQDYAKFSEPFDKMVLEAVRSAPMNTLHLHGDKVYLDHFYKGWPAAVINYSAFGTKVPITQVRQKYSGVIMGGLDENNVGKGWLSMKVNWTQAYHSAGNKFILTPGCSVPNDSADNDLMVIPRMFGAV